VVAAGALALGGAAASSSTIRNGAAALFDNLTSCLRADQDTGLAINTICMAEACRHGRSASDCRLAVRLMLINRIISTIPLVIVATLISQHCKAHPPECVAPLADCLTSECLVARADGDCNGMLSALELDSLDDELDGLVHRVPTVRSVDRYVCRQAFDRPSREWARTTYVSCRAPGLRLD